MPRRVPDIGKVNAAIGFRPTRDAGPDPGRRHRIPSGESTSTTATGTMQGPLTARTEHASRESVGSWGRPPESAGHEARTRGGVGGGLSEPMRIVHVITRLIIGGAQENTLLTVEGLHHRHGDDVTLITGPAEGPEGDLFERAAARAA